MSDNLTYYVTTSLFLRDLSFTEILFRIQLSMVKLSHDQFKTTEGTF